MTNRRVRAVLFSAGTAFGLLGLLWAMFPLARNNFSWVTTLLICIGWLLLLALLIGDRRGHSERDHLRIELKTHDDRELNRTNRILTAIGDERAKESRHEYHMERSLERIEARLGQLSTRSGSAPHAVDEEHLDVLFVTSNGAGLGHITRLKSIARHLGSDLTKEFLTLSQAYRSLAETGDTIHYFPSADAAGTSPKLWNRAFERHFAALVEDRRPRVVVFDGTWVYYGLTYVCRDQAIPLVWVQRGNWKNEVDQVSPQRHNAISVVDEVIIPGDFAIAEQVDVGPEIEAVRTEPITLMKRSDLLKRPEAITELGLDPSVRYVLVNVGGGSLGDQTDVRKTACEAIHRLGESWQPVVVESPLTSGGTAQSIGAVEISAYPVARYFMAFEFVVAAAGYNSVQETISLGVPSVIVPNSRSITDDQVARAQGAAEAGWAISATTAAGIRDAIAQMADDAQRAKMVDRLSAVEEANGAESAAQALESIVQQSRWTTKIDRIGTTKASAKSVTD